MGKSRRSSPVCGITTARTEKAWKRTANRKLRKACETVVTEDFEGVLPLKHEVSNQFDGPKDGRQRFDPTEFPKLMRK